jgi:hypothetical protein
VGATGDAAVANYILAGRHSGERSGRWNPQRRHRLAYDARLGRH